MVDRDPFTEFVKNVKTLEAVGISPPPDWTNVHQRLVDFLRLKRPSRDKLIAAIAEGDGDVAALRAQAYAEATVVPATRRCWRCQRARARPVAAASVDSLLSGKDDM